MNENYSDLIKNLIKLGYLKTPSVIDAFKKVDRKCFVPKEYKNFAYKDVPIPMGFDQKMSQPSIVAFMLELLDVHTGQNVLEIGSGSGWQTAILGGLIPDDKNSKQSRITSIESIKELFEIAKRNINKCNGVNNKNITVINGNGFYGKEEFAPYDRIISSVSYKELLKSWEKQLKIGGKIVFPVKESIFYIEKISKNEFFKKEFPGFSFMELVK